jgi:hypothetical protein
MSQIIRLCCHARLVLDVVKELELVQDSSATPQNASRISRREMTPQVNKSGIPGIATSL